MKEGKTWDLTPIRMKKSDPDISPEKAYADMTPSKAAKPKYGDAPFNFSLIVPAGFSSPSLIMLLKLFLPVFSILASF
jgi:hypothetical protein